MTSATGRRRVLLASALGSSLAPFMVAGMIVALPAIGDEFSAEPALLGLVTTSFFLAAAVFLVPFGRIADSFGTKKVFLTGIVIYLASVLLSISSPTVWFLIGARFVTGVGAGMVFGTSIALISLVFPESERGKAIGINVTAMFLGFLSGFLFGGLLTYYLSWRWIFAVTIPVELLVAGLVLLRLRGECEISGRRDLDFPGIFLYSLTLFLFMAGFSVLPGLSGVLGIISGFFALGFFIVRELHTGDPLLDIRLFTTNRTFAASNLTALLFNAANFATVFLLSLYLQDIIGIDARVAGVILLIPVALMAAFSTFAGRMADRIDSRRVIAVGIGMLSTGLLLFSLVDRDTGIPVVLAGLVMYGSGLAFFQSPLVRTLVSSVPREVYGLSSGLIETMRLLGMTISIAITIIVFTLLIGDIHITPSISDLFLPAMRTLFITFFILSIISLGAAFLIPGGSSLKQSANVRSR
ncbi:MAG: MFS transporter [Methanoregulaceae archaeon]|nr:MFS transporter [Methanoregulaceae archaeon]